MKFLAVMNEAFEDFVALPQNMLICLIWKAFLCSPRQKVIQVILKNVLSRRGKKDSLPQKGYLAHSDGKHGAGKR